MFKKILVPVDGSEHSVHALDYALDVAEKYSANILLLSVFHAVYSFIGVQPNFAPPSALDILEAQKSYHEKVLTEALQRAKELKPELEVSTRLVEGRPAEIIIETAREGNFDLIVIGSRGLGGISQLLLGSVSDRVADSAPCPVLIIK